jgi:hypothetical protein
MNKQIKNIFSVFIFIIISTLIPSSANATVGGPTTINDFKYNHADESIYYIVNSYSGRGCPPMLYKMGLVSKQIEVVYSCDEGEEFTTNNPKASIYSQFNEITGNFKYLPTINLKNNDISIDVNYIGEGNTNPVGMSKKVKVVVYQNEKKIDEFETTACNLEQPFIFEGYEIPGFEKKIMLLMSAKRDCFEGGYVVESLHVINGINGINRTGRTNLYKGNDILSPDESSLIVFEKYSSVKNDNAVKQPAEIKTDENTNEQLGDVDTEPTEEKENNNLIILATALVSIALGIFLGKVVFKK